MAMEAVVKTSELLKAIKEVSAFKHKRNTTLSSFNNIIFEVVDGMLNITMNKDGKISFTKRIDTSRNIEGFKYCVDIELFTNTIKNFDKKKTTTLSFSEGSLRIECGVVKTKIEAISSQSDKYNNSVLPVLEAKGDEITTFTYKINETYLHEAVKFTTNDEYRPSMTGVTLKNHENQLRVYGTNGNFLYKNVVEGIEFNKELDFIIPKIVIEKTSKDEMFVISLFIDNQYDKLGVFENRYTKIAFKAIDERSVGFESVIPQDEDLNYIFTFNKSELIDAVKNIGDISPSKTVVIDFDRNSISGSNVDYNLLTEIELNITNKSNKEIKEVHLGVNSTLLLIVLNNYDSNEVVLKTTSIGEKPIMFCEKNKTLLLMPVMLKNYY